MSGILKDELERKLKSITAKDIMTDAVIMVKKDMTLADLADMLLKKRISGVPVVDDYGKLIGVITVTDLFNLTQMLKSGAIVEDGRLGVYNPTVDLVMSADFVSISGEITLDEIMKTMFEHNIHTLPVLKDTNLKGIVGRRDVLKHFYSIIGELSRKE